MRRFNMIHKVHQQEIGIGFYREDGRNWYDSDPRVGRYDFLMGEQQGGGGIDLGETCFQRAKGGSDID